MKPLTRILFKIQDLIGKIISKLEPPQPFHSQPLPEIPYINTATDDWYGTYNYTFANLQNITFTVDGSAGINPKE